MPRPFTPKIATANHLMEGDVIYFTDPGWSRDHADAAVAAEAGAAEALLARASQEPHLTVGVYLADVALTDGRPTPTHFRETFRTRGPSNYFHGKQAE